MKVHVLKYVFSCMVLFFVFQQDLLSQDQAPYTVSNLTPPSPAAYELGKYGQTPVGLFSGTILQTIPLYEFHTKNLTVPLMLNYSSNGIKVDELGSKTGLGWSLTMGGVITRIVRDLPDNERNQYLPDEIIHRPGGTESSEALTYFNDAGSNPEFDSETDLFMFNFNGHSGKFIIDNDHKIVMMPKQDIKIEPVVVSADDGFKITTSDGVVYTFLEKEDSRNQASRGGKSPAEFYLSAWYLSTITHPNGDVITFVYETEAYDYVASQQQTLISTPFQTSCDGIIGVSHSIVPIISYNLFVHGVKLKEIHSNISDEGRILITSSLSHPEVSGYSLISNIQFVNNTNQEIERFDFTYLKTTNKRVFLEKIAMKDPNKNYQFTYDDPTNVPPRLSFAQDHWGYYNGEDANKDLFPRLTDPKYEIPDIVVTYMINYNKGAKKEINSSYTSKGILTRITYPTKGYSNFTYEPNSYRGTKTVYPPISKIDVWVETKEEDHSNPSQSKSTQNILFDHEAEIDLGISMSSDPTCIPDPIHNRAVFSIKDLTFPNTKPNFYQKTVGSLNFLANPFIFSPNTSHGNCFVRLVAGHRYEIKIDAMAPCVAASAGLNYYQTNKTEVPANITTGGVRIQKVETYDGINSTPQIMRYYYGRKESPDVSSGNEGLMPTYLNTATDYNKCALGNYEPITRFKISSNSLNALYNSIGVNTIGYKFVTISNGGNNFENGGEEHEFILSSDTPSKNIQGDYIPSAPWCNTGFQNGYEKTVTIFTRIGTVITVLKTRSNTYVRDPRYHEEVYGYVVQKKYDNIFTSPLSYTCSADDAKRTWTHIECSANHKHNWGVPLLSNEWKCIAIGNDNKEIVSYDQCYGQQGKVITSTSILENLNIAEYKYVSNWEYLSSSVTTTYDVNGGNGSSTTTFYEYGNPVHMQATAIATILENAGTNTQRASYTKKYFLQDYTYPGTLIGTAAALKAMSDKHIWNTPIEQLNYSIIGSVYRLIGGELTTFKMNGTSVVKDKDYRVKCNGSTIYQDLISVTPASINSSGQFIYDAHYEQLNSCNRYDTKNNLVELTDRKDTSSFIREPNTGYVWAKTINSIYGDVAYSSFEQTTTSSAFTNWFYNRTGITTNSSQSGQKALDLSKSFIVSQQTLNTSKKYKISFWKNINTGTFSVMAGSHVVTPRPGPIRNGWQYFECTFTNVTKVQVTGYATIDEIRLYPENARMTTYVYKDGIISSECNDNNQTTFWEYDDFNRLKLTRDQNGNILKKNEYKYQVQY